VGAGDSLLAELLVEHGRSLSQLLITDANPAMLTHSTIGARLGAHSSCQSDALPVRDGEVGLIISSLEIRTMSPLSGGGCSGTNTRRQGPVTSPSYDFAHAYATAPTPQASSWGTVGYYRASIVLSEDEQRAMIEDAGLSLVSVTHFKRGDVPSTTPDDLDCLGPNNSVVTCFECSADTITALRARITAL